MKVNGKKLTALLGVAVLTMGMLTGYGSTTTKTTATGTAAPATTTEMAAETSAVAGETKDQAATEAENAPSADLNDTISMVGPTSMEKFANVFSESFIERYPNVTVTAESIESGAGTKAVNNRIADIGNSPRNLKDGEKAGGVTENIVAIDRIAVVVDGANAVEDLTEQRLSDIYEGRITNWRDTGGNDTPTVVIGHESGSGTRSAFGELLKLGGMYRYNNELDSTGAVVAKVVSTSGAIGYASLDVLDDTIKVVKLEDAEPTEGNIKVGSYFLSRPFVMATKENISEQNELIKVLFDYIYSDGGAEIAKSMGLIAVDK